MIKNKVKKMFFMIKYDKFVSPFITGLTGIDSGQKRYVSMPGIGMLAR
jgi:hypothetical protein